MLRTVLSIALVLATQAAGLATADDAAVAPPMPQMVPATYALFPGDLLLLQVFDNPELETTIRVPATGVMAFPLIGQIDGLVGRNLEGVRDEIARRLLDGYLRQAVVTITVREFGVRFAYVLGSVGAPREILLNPLATTTAMQAIGKAGGFTEDADRSRAQVLRQDPQAPERRIAFPLPATDEAGAMVGDIALQPGDMVVVARLDRVYVLGQIDRPGAVRIPPDEPLTLAKAISLAGGFSRYAKQSEVQVLRAGKRVLLVDARDVLTGKQPDPRLEPGDTVFVPESRL